MFKFIQPVFNIIISSVKIPVLAGYFIATIGVGSADFLSKTLNEKFKFGDGGMIFGIPSIFAGILVFFFLMCISLMIKLVKNEIKNNSNNSIHLGNLYNNVIKNYGERYHSDEDSLKTYNSHSALVDLKNDLSIDESTRDNLDNFLSYFHISKKTYVRSDPDYYISTTDKIEIEGGIDKVRPKLKKMAGELLKKL